MESPAPHRSLPRGVALLDAELCIRHASAEFCGQMGLPQDVVGKRAEQVFPVEWLAFLTALLSPTDSGEPVTLPDTVPSVFLHAFSLPGAVLLTASSSLPIADRLHRIAQITRRVLTAAPRAEIMSEIAEHLRGIFEVDVCVIRELRGELLHLLAKSGTTADLSPTLPATRGLASRILGGGQPIAVADVQTLPALPPLAASAGFEFRSYAGAPLIIDGEMVGILGIYAVHARRDFREEDFAHLEIAAQSVAALLVNTRLYQEVAEQKGQIEQRLAQIEQAQASLRASETRFQAIFDHSFDGIAVSTQGKHVYCNPAYARMFGFSHPRDLAGVPVTQILAESDRERMHQQNLRRESGSTSEPAVYEVRCRRANGSEFPAENHASTYSLDDQTFTVVMTRDITAQKRMQERQQTLLRQQQQIARVLQGALLRMPDEDAFPGLRVRTLHEAALDDSDVSGDFFSLFLLPNDRLALGVGDVSGKGLQVAALTAEIKYVIGAHLNEIGQPARVLQRVNHYLCAGRQRRNNFDHAWQEAFVCLSLAVVDLKTGRMQISAAGAEMPRLLRVRGGRVHVRKVRSGGLPLGVDPQAVYASVGYTLQPGDILALLTDGLTEARHKNRFFGDGGVDRALRRSIQSASLGEMADQVYDAVLRFSQGTLRDDVCLLLAQRVSPFAQEVSRLDTVVAP